MARPKPPAWTGEEIAILREVYPSQGLKGVADLLPERSWTAIHVMASKLGIKCELVTDAPKTKLQGERLERAIEMREVRGWSFERIGAELGVCESSACNAVMIALCERKGYRPAERAANGRLLPEGRERLRYALRKGYKAVEIQLRLGLSASRIAEERRRYNAELKAAGKALLPPPGGGEAYSGVKIPKDKVAEIEGLLLTGLGTLKVHERTGVPKVSIIRIRAKLVKRLKRKGECLPGCDLNGKRHTVYASKAEIPAAAIAEFRRLLLEERLSAVRAGLRSGIGGSSAYRLRNAIAAELAAEGNALPPPLAIPTRGKAYRRILADDALYPTGRGAIIAWRNYAAEHGYPAARQKLIDDRAAAAAAAREESRRPKSFEEQLARVQAGAAGIVAKFVPTKAAPDMTLGGVATGAL